MSIVFFFRFPVILAISNGLFKTFLIVIVFSDFFFVFGNNNRTAEINRSSYRGFLIFIFTKINRY